MRKKINHKFSQILTQEVGLSLASCVTFLILVIPAGWGQRDWLVAGLLIAYASDVMSRVVGKDWAAVAILTPIYLCCLVWVDLVLLFPVIGSVLAFPSNCSTTKTLRILIAVLCFSLSTLNSVGVCNWIFQPVILFCFGCLVLVTSIFLNNRYYSGVVRTLHVTAVIAGLVLIPSLLNASNSVAPKELQFSDVNQVSFGVVAEKLIGQRQEITNLIIPDTGEGGVVRDVASVGSGKSIKRDFILLEHDAESDFFAGINLHQQKPWGQNIFTGDQFLVSSLAQDGLYASNLGGSIDNYSGQPLLFGNCFGQFLDSEVLLATDSNNYVFHDSDVFVDKLSAYNKHFIQAVTGNDKFRHLSALISCFCPLFLLLKKQLRGNLLYTMSMLVSCCLPHVPETGDIRLVGALGSPHNESLAIGVPRVLNEQQFNFNLGSLNAKVLVVAANKTAVHFGEELVLLEAGATCWTTGGPITCVKDPLGNESGVVNAMPLVANGLKSNPIVKRGSTTFIGTGSPAKQNFKEWILP